MIEETRDEACEEAYGLGLHDARAGMAGDIRTLIDFFNSEIRSLRREVAALAGLPVPSLLDVNGDRPQ